MIKINKERQNMRKLKADEIECRVAQISEKGYSLLLYKTARVDRAILDEIYQNRWQNDFKVIDGKMYGGIGVYDKDLKEWLWRWDCGTESNTEAEKGQASDCFKRAGFKWGIGVELYTAPFIWITGGTKQNNKGKYELENKFTKWKVKEIGYAENGDINKLEIVDDKGKQVYKMGENKQPKPESEKPKPKSQPKPTNPDADLDLLQGLYATSTMKSAHEYYKEYENCAVNTEIFKNEYIKHYKELQKKGV